MANLGRMSIKAHSRPIDLVVSPISSRDFVELDVLDRSCAEFEMDIDRALIRLTGSPLLGGLARVFGLQLDSRGGRGVGDRGLIRLLDHASVVDQLDNP